MEFHKKIACAVLACTSVAAAGAESRPPADAGQYRAWVQQMKADPRGPFSGIRWYCKDGSVLPAKAGCSANGGGHQHGQWSERTQRLRASGYPVANILVRVPPASIAGPDADPDLLGFILVEKFLIASDEGWILRRAQYYRGAFQDYNERDAANAILQAMLSTRERPEFAVLREAARLLPHGPETAAITRLRAAAAKIAERDAGFKHLRAKIHSLPEAGDAARVRAYASGAGADPGLAGDYAELAAMIDRSNATQPLPAALRAHAAGARTPEAAARLREVAAALERDAAPAAQLRHGAEALTAIRDHLHDLGTSKAQLAALDTSIAAETAVFAASRAVLQQLPSASREQRMAWMLDATRAVYGLGLFTARERDEIARIVAGLEGRVRLSDYRDELAELTRAASWPARRLEYHFGNAIAKLSELEPLAAGYIPDRLRGSPLLFYSDVLQSLAADADRLSGTRHRIFGQETSGGLRRLNPGLARGVLLTEADMTRASAQSAIYLVPETTAELPAAAGILTASEGNALSHVQLLARNLGIPNVVAGGPLHAQLAARRGRPIVIAASSGGVVHIEDDAPQWDRLFERASAPAASIMVNPGKLELWRRELVPTSQLRAGDSGRIAGPKAAQVGELAHQFPGRVAPGLAVTFGIYRELLDQPVRPGGPRMFDWLRAQYAELGVRKNLDPGWHARRVPELLAYVREWLQTAPLPPDFSERLRHAMFDEFGMEGTYGVFVRSDTNVEDLPGFTGAGLNLTLPNVVGARETLKAIRQVWASPFTERAYGWRQGLMDQPEHVYASVLLHRSVPNEKSGVLVTANLDTGSREEITVVTNAGVGGGVDGQAAETLRVRLKGGDVRLLASATAPTRRVLDPAGGVRELPAPAPDALLTDKEIGQLADFVRKFPKKYPGLEDAEGEIAPADIEFGFAHGQLQLLQIRPFLRSAAASRNQYLAELDAGLRKSGGKKVNLRDVPEENAS